MGSVRSADYFHDRHWCCQEKHVEHISDNDVVILNFEILYASEMVGLNQRDLFVREVHHYKIQCLLMAQNISIPF